MQIFAVEELAAASDLTAEEYGAYLLLRIYQWQNGALPTDDDRLARIAHVAANRWTGVSAVIRPKFGPNWLHEATHHSRQKSAETHERLSKAGQKGGRSNGKTMPSAVPATFQAASVATSLASARLKADPVPRKSEAPLLAKAGCQAPYPAISDPDSADTWLQERSAFPPDRDKLKCLLMAGELTPAILKRSAP